MLRRRPITACLFALAIAAAAGGCAVGDGSDDQAESRKDAPTEPATTVEEGELEQGDVDTGELRLEDVDDSGVTGTVRIEPGEGDRLDIKVELDGEQTGTHGIDARLGSCAEALDPGAAQALLEDASTYTLADIEDGSMEDSVKLPDDIVSEGTYSLAVHEGAGVDGDIVACVDVEVE
jgi:hypothetical protein